jgi:hypothetical protein
MHDLVIRGGTVQRVDGYRHVIKSGTETLCNGEHTGALPGALFRGGRRAA